MDPLRRFAAQFRDYWSGLSRVRRVAMIAATVGLLLVVGAAYYLAPSTNYVILTKEAPIEDSLAITTKLRGATPTIDARTSDGGTTIRVPEAQFDQARAVLAAEGLLTRGGKGYELFDESSLTTTPFTQSVNYQRALQAELARLITQIEAVKSAKVLISQPEPTAFVRPTQPPTASVVLTLKPGATISRTTADSIVSLVSRSVLGLKPENVTVMESRGRLLSDPHAADRDNLPAPQLEYRRELENYLASKAEEMLARHLGTGRAVVKVSADVNFQKVKERSETYTPEGRVAAAERQTTSKMTAASARGVAGATSNVSRATGGGSGSSGGNSSEEVVQTDYLVSRTVRDLEDRMGAVTRLTVAVLADLTVPGESGKVISPEDAQEITKQAIGFRTGRDEIKFSNVKLAVPETPPEPDEELVRLQRVQTYVSLARNVCAALAVVLVVTLIPLVLLRRRAVPPPVEVAKPTTELEQLVELARRDPDRVAEVFRGLLGGR